MGRKYGYAQSELAKLPENVHPEQVAREKAFQGKPVKWHKPRAVVLCVLTKVNAPCKRQINGEELAAEIRAGNISFTQVDSIYTEIDVVAQKIFAAELDIPEDALYRTARA